MEIANLTISWLLIAVGTVGSLLNKLLAPLIAYIGLLLMVDICGLETKWQTLLIIAILVIGSILIPICFGSLIMHNGIDNIKGGHCGAIAGTFLGLLTSEISGAETMAIIKTIVQSIVVYPMAAAFIVEIICKKSVQAAFQATKQAYKFYMVNTMLKIIACIYMIYIIV